jgi:hypothetical protein
VRRYYWVKQRNTYTGLDRPLGLQEVEAPRVSRQSAHEGGKIVVSHTHRPLLPPRRYPCYSFLLEAESTQIPLGIEPATFPACGAVPQPTAPPRTAILLGRCESLQERRSYN